MQKLTNSQKTLLIVNYDFPPAGGAGIKRCLKFIKYLPENKWNCIILTVKNGNHTVIDRSLLNEVIHNEPVFRAFTFESLFNDESDHNATRSHKNNKSNVPVKPYKNIIRSIYKGIGKLVRVPDSRILWLPLAFVAALRINKRLHYDAIYATGPTFTNLILGSMIKIALSKPLITDFRDAWVSDPMLIKGQKKYKVRMHEMLERFVVKYSNRVISTNPFVTRDFQKRYSGDDFNKFITIYNGYDVSDYKNMQEFEINKTGKFTIAYTGILYGERTPKHFLKAVQTTLNENPGIRDTIQIIFAGKCMRFLDGYNIEDYLNEYNLNDVVKLTGHVSRNESLKIQMSSDLLLMLVGIVPEEMELTYGLSGKIFDYILCGKPILTLANGGATREFILDNKIGEIFFHENLIGIKNYLIMTHNKFRNGTLKEEFNISAYEKFDFRSLTKILSFHLDDVSINRA